MTQSPDLARAALVVCGGRSLRMGTSKAMLPFGDETMLERIVRIVQPHVEEVVLLTAKFEAAPELPFPVVELQDRVEDQGPAASIADGLKFVGNWADLALVVACDMPLVTPKSIEYLFSEIGQLDAVIPRVKTLPQPLAAVYRTTCFEAFENTLASGNRRLLSCIEGLSTRWIGPEELGLIDPHLGLLRNVNTPEAYQDALEIAGISNQTTRKR